MDLLDMQESPAEVVTEPTGYDAIGAMDAEPASVTAIKEEQKARLEASEAKSKEDSATMEAAAKAELDEWHAKNEKAKAEKATRNAEEEAAFIAKRDETTPGNEWERVAFLLDLSGSKKTVKDTSRMKSMLIQLKTAGK